MFHVIQDAVIETESCLRLTYQEGDRVVIDFRPVIAQGGVFEPLADPDFFQKVSVGGGGRYLEWPGGIDFCADALWEEAHEKSAVS